MTTEDQELEDLLTMLRGSGPDLAVPPPEARENFEAMLANLPMADDLSFAPTRLGSVSGLRITSAGVAEDAALLYLHGGAYVIGSAHGYRGLAGELGRATGVTVYSADYRLAPEHPFPAAVEDALAAYRGLMAKGISPSRIVIAGDSAGGGLTLAMLMAAHEQGLPMPAAALLLSPWADLSLEGASIKSKAEEDPSLTEEGLAAMGGMYLDGEDPHTALASPIHGDFTGLPPLLIHVGSSEILMDDAVSIARAAGAAGVHVQLEIWPRMMHVWHAFGLMLTAGRRATQAAGAFLSSRLGQG